MDCSRAAAALLLAAAAALPAPAAAEEPPRREVSAGCVFPAGGRRGATLEVIVHGQGIAGAEAALVGGGGVKATLLRTMRPLNPMQMRELRRRLVEVRTKRKVPREEGEETDLPSHPLIDGLAGLDAKGLREVERRFLGEGARRQANPQLAETAEVRIAIDAEARPGERELRLGTPRGLTNPLRFHVGTLPEVVEEEAAAGDGEPFPLPDLPVLVNGRILPGDADRLRFRARRGQDLVVRVAARRLVPFLADAVPGWFQATAAILDGSGREVAYADGWREDPDPVILFRVPRDGEYVLEIRDSLWRGREDFVYRASLGEEPFVTRIFPLGGPAGVATLAAAVGWNLPSTRIPLDTGEGGGDASSVRHLEARRGGSASNPVAYAVDDLPECLEREPNDDAGRAEVVPLPRVVNGRIGRPGDVDVFRFLGFAGDAVVAEVEARRLGSPVDSLLRLTDGEGRVLAWNDDREGGGGGTLTFDADSRISLVLPADGPYRLEVRDAQGHGGEEYGYRLRVGPPRPSFEVRALPSGVAVAAGRSAAFRLRAERRDGFAGDIEVVLAGEAAGFRLDGGRIPAGRAEVRATLTAPARPPEGGVALRLEARAAAGEGTIRRPVIAADEEVQAFLWRHLVEAGELVAWATGPRRGPEPSSVATEVPVRVPEGGTALVRVRLPGRTPPADLRLAAVDPPPGITVEETAVVPGMLAFLLRADGVRAKAGLADNLVVEASVEREAEAGRDGRARGRQRASLGVLPAIPFEVVGR